MEGPSSPPVSRKQKKKRRGRRKRRILSGKPIADSVDAMTSSPDPAKCEDLKDADIVVEGDSPGANLPNGSERPKALLQNLRQEGLFFDGVITVGDSDFPVHRAVVAHLSAFFFKSFSSEFAEARARKLAIKNASPDAVSVILDYAYGLDVTDALKKDLKLAIEVWKLAHRYEISELCENSGFIAVESCTIQNCVQLYKLADLLDYAYGVDKMFMFIVQRLKEILDQCEDFNYHITVHELEDFLISEELIAAEVAKYQCVKNWVESVTEGGREEWSEHLLGYVDFQLMEETDLQLVLMDIEFLPKKVLCKALERSVWGGFSLSNLFMGDLYDGGSDGEQALVGAEFALPLGQWTGNCFRLPSIEFRCKCNRWVVYALASMCSEDLDLILHFERRHIAPKTYCTLSSDLQSYRFDVETKIACRTGSPFETLQHYGLPVKSNGISARILESPSANKSRSSVIDGEDLTLLVRLSYVEASTFDYPGSTDCFAEE